MTRLVITRKQFETLKEIFDEYDIDQVVWTEENTSGIGPNTYIEFDPTATQKIDITDVSTW